MLSIYEALGSVPRTLEGGGEKRLLPLLTDKLGSFQTMSNVIEPLFTKLLEKQCVGLENLGSWEETEAAVTVVQIRKMKA